MVSRPFVTDLQSLCLGAVINTDKKEVVAKILRNIREG
jgi:hypothetical protein